MSVEYRLLGPLEALVDGEAVNLGGPRQRALLAMLLVTPGEVVPVSRLVDEVWANEPPETVGNVLQGYVSRLRKVLGREAIVTRGRGYVLVADDDAIDLRRFERRASAGSRALEDGQAQVAASELRGALALWRGPALADIADEPFAHAIASRLDELRLAAAERAIEADLGCGRHAEVVAELDGLIARHPLRERLRELQMRALYAAGRQADALAAYRAARAVLVEQLGIEPGAALQELEAAVLRQDDALGPADVAAGGLAGARHTRTVLLAVLDPAAAAGLGGLAAGLARSPERELVVATTVAVAADLAAVSADVHDVVSGLAAEGVAARGAAFTSMTPGADLARLAVEQRADLVLTDAPGGLLEDASLLSLLDEAPSDVAIVVGATAPGEGPVVVPFTGAEHDWAAVELGAWLAGALERPLHLVGASTGESGRDASRLLASASLAVQRALGVVAVPVIVEPEPAALVAAAGEAAVVATGLPARWRREGLGRARTALAAAAQDAGPLLLVRRGLRPGGLAPGDGDTRFTWTVMPPGS